MHGSGAAESRITSFRLARFLIRHGMAVLGYDKRGVGGSTGDWNTASFDDLAGDVVAAFEYLKTRSDIDRTQIGLLGVEPGGMDHAARGRPREDLAFLISVSGAGVPAAETTIDQARNEMTAARHAAADRRADHRPPEAAVRIRADGPGWDEYIAAREKIAARLGKPPDTIPGNAGPSLAGTSFDGCTSTTPSRPFVGSRSPTLALFGELDNNILAEKNKAAWEAALKAGGNRDYTLRILPKANHAQCEAKIGSNAEMKSLQRFVPAYFTTIQDWLANRIRRFDKTR